MKHFIRDASQIVIAVLLTTSMVVVNAQAPKSAVSKPELIHKAVLATKSVIGTPVAAAAVTAAPVAPVLTQHEQWMQTAGIAQSDWPAVEFIVSHESGWCTTKWEGEFGICPAYHGYSSDGYGLCQSTPADKMAIEGPGWETDPVLQLKWCALHAAGYGGWWASYDHWIGQIPIVGHGNW